MVWNSANVALLLGVAVAMIGVLALVVSAWIHAHTGTAMRLHGWAGDAESLARSLLPQFLELGLLLLAIAGFVLLFA